MTNFQPSRQGKPSAVWLLGYQRLAGTCDLATGLLLLLFPGWTMELLGFRDPTRFASYEIISLIGVFVLATGLAYWVTARLPTASEQWVRWQTTMIITAVTRTAVAFYLTVQWVRGQMEWPWMTVALSDGALASFQYMGLRKGWWQ